MARITIQDIALRHPPRILITTTMPSEKWKYAEARMARMNRQRTDIEMTLLKEEIEAVFSPRNLDNDCHTISKLLAPYCDRLKDLLANGKYSEAVTLFLEIVESLCYHFVEDEHFNYFDDMYDPDYDCEYMLNALVAEIKAGRLPEAEQQRLAVGIAKLKSYESYEDYGYPYIFHKWDSNISNAQS